MSRSSKTKQCRRSLAVESLESRAMLTTYALLNNPVLQSIDAEVFVEDTGQGSVVIDLESRKVSTSNTYYVDERFSGNGTQANPFNDIKDALARIDSLRQSSATIRVAAGDYSWGDVIRNDPSEGGSATFSASLNVLGSGSGLTRVRQQGTESSAAVFNESGRSLYVEGMSFIGRGPSGVAAKNDDVFAARNGTHATFVDTVFRNSTKGDGLFVLKFDTVVIVDSIATNNEADGFSYTKPSDNSPSMYVLESGVQSYGNGTNGRTSSQGSSIHRETQIVRVNSIYRNNPTNLEDTGLTSWNVNVTAQNATEEQSGDPMNFRVRGDKQEATDGLAWLISGSYSNGGIVNARATTANNPQRTPVFGNIRYSSLFDIAAHPPSVLTADSGAAVFRQPNDSQLVLVSGDPPNPDPPNPDPPNPDPPDPNPDPPNPDPPNPDSDATVFYRNRNASVRSDDIEAQIGVRNDGSAPVNFRGAEVRYYFDPDALTPVVTVDKANAATTSTFVASGSYASATVTEDFFVNPGASWTFRFEIFNQQNANFDQANDPSFVASQTNLAQTDRIDFVPPDATDPPNPDPPNPDPPNPDPPNPDPPNPDPPNPDAPIVRLVYLNKSPRASSSEIEAKLELYNDGSSRANFKGMEIRYFMDADGLTPEVDLNFAGAPTDAIEFGYVADGYAVFRIVDDVFIGAGNRLKLQFTITNVEGGLFDQSNDDSFIASQTARAVSRKIDVWLAGERIWGT